MLRIVLLVAAVVTAACGSDAGSSVPDDWPTTAVRVNDHRLTLAVADSPEERSQGLRGVTDLGPIDGVLFVFADPTATAFTMRGVTLPLDIAFVDAAGRVLDVVALEPCSADPCPSYASPGEIAWAIEVPRGGLDGVGPGDALVIGP